MAEKTPLRPVDSYTAQEVMEIAQRADRRRGEDFIVPPDSVELYVEALVVEI